MNMHPFDSTEHVYPDELADIFAFESGTVVDFGCGTGALVLQIARHIAENSEVYGVDAQKDLVLKLLREAKEMNLKNVKGIWGDFEVPNGSKLSDMFADFVVIVNSLFQVEDKSGALKEAFRILKKSGELYIVDWKQDSVCPIGPPVKLRVSAEDVKLHALSAGFKYEEERDIKSSQFMLKFTK